MFTYGDDEYISSLGWCIYTMDGSYQELTTFLQGRVNIDYRTARIVELQERLLRSVFDIASRLNELNQVAPMVVETVGDSVYCITHIINGKPRADDVAHRAPHEFIPDYLRIYWKESGFDFPQMINDDFMDAMKLLWNKRKYISTLKLLVIMIDTLGFLEYGPKASDSFARWMDEFCKMDLIGVTSRELWELRNSLLHMTNLDSRRGHRGDVKRLQPAITHPDNDILVDMKDFRVLHLSRLLTGVVPDGIANWIRSFDGNQAKFLEFVQRYDTVVSDSRTTAAMEIDSASNA